MSRFFIEGLTEKASGDVIILDGDNAHHAVSVLRLRAGDALTVCDGARVDYLCEVISVNKNGKAGVVFLELRVLERHENQNEPAARIFLFQSFIKSDKLEWAAQKAVELGAAGLTVFPSEHSVVRSSGGQNIGYDRDAGCGEKLLRLRKIVEGAAKQSGRGVIPIVTEAAGLSEAICSSSFIKPSLALAAHEKSVVSLKSRIASHKAGEAISIFIGPEGGFSEMEVNEMENQGILAFSLGKRILRAETAGLAAIANILYELEG